ncbi:MAG: hypothetical protein ABFE07_04610 [Armatimonadia bacterium]|nr:hypothetical protein [Betaproteobacteria bacterium]
MADAGYIAGGGASSASADGTQTHDALKRQYLNYLDTKREEIREQQEARRYYHGAHWTAEQIKTLNKRKQPIVTYNRIGRKINAIVGLLSKQRQDPRGFPRTQGHEQGAEVATAVLRYVCDAQEWETKDPLCGLNGAVDGIGGVEIVLEQAATGDMDVGFEIVDPSGFFYDPRSLRPDFADARYMGLGKWADVDTVIEMFPDKEQGIRASIDSGADLTSNPDSDVKWIDGSEGSRKVRLVDHWYVERGQWNYCVYTGAVELARGQSFITDERGKLACKYIMFSSNVDHDGDRYGFVRNMKSANDEINQRRSKGLHIGNSRRMIIEEGGGLEIEKVRREAARPDGVITYPNGTAPPVFDDAARGQELAAQLGFLEEAKAEIENYGFNPALIGTGVQDMSGRAIQLQQQAGIAELGPYLLAYRGWKLRVYRAIWETVKRHWTAERWVRVTDDEGVAQFMSVNRLTVDPRTGAPAIENALGSLDVDIIIDEGPDTINMQADAYDTLTIMAQKGQEVPPEVLIELSPLHGSVKKKIMGMIEQAQQRAAQMPPQAQQAMQLEMAGKDAENKLTQAQTVKTMAEAQNIGAGEDPRAAMMEASVRQQEGQIKLANTVAKAQADQTKSALDIRGKELDLVGKQLDIQRLRETPPPQPPRAA